MKKNYKMLGKNWIKYFKKFFYGMSESVFILSKKQQKKFTKK